MMSHMTLSQTYHHIFIRPKKKKKPLLSFASLCSHCHFIRYSLSKYMPRIFRFSSQCRCSPDRAAMRLVGPLPGLRPHRLSTLFSFGSASSRQLHGSTTRFHPHDENAAEVFPESLQKTLEAHRAFNRASLFRVVNTTAPPKKNRRPTTHRAVTKPHQKQGEDQKQVTLESTQKPRISRRELDRQIKSRLRSDYEKPPEWVNQQLRWSVSVLQNRPEQWPWLSHHAGDHASDATAQLDAEIRALDAYLTPTSDEQNKVDGLVNTVSKLLEDASHRPQLSGSWRTGVASTHSDLDFVLPVPDIGRSKDDIRKPSSTRPQVLEAYHNLLERVQQTLWQISAFKDRTFLVYNRNPFLSAIHRPTGIRVRFQCKESIPSSVEYISDYLAEYPAVRPLYRATRLILEAQELFGPDRSSIGTNALLMLLVAFCKMNHGRFQRSHSLGLQLLAFLRTYGIDVDLAANGVAVDPPGWFSDESVRCADEKWSWPEEIPAHIRGQRALINIKRTAGFKCNGPVADHLCIQDPTNYMNDLGRFCTRTRDIQNVWAAAHARLRTASDHWDASGASVGQSILTHGLRANFEDFERKRHGLADAPGIRGLV